MTNWHDILPADIAKRQVAWDRRKLLLRAVQAGYSTADLVARYRVSTIRINQLLRQARREIGRPSPAERFMQDDSPFQDLANKVKKSMTRRAPKKPMRPKQSSTTALMAH